MQEKAQDPGKRPPMTNQHLNFKNDIEEEETETEQESPRVDMECFCALRMRSILIIDGVCFSRVHNCDCRQCIYDCDAQDRIFVRLIWVLCDSIEGATEQRRRGQTPILEQKDACASVSFQTRASGVASLNNSLRTREADRDG